MLKHSGFLGERLRGDLDLPGFSIVINSNDLFLGKITQNTGLSSFILKVKNISLDPNVCIKHCFMGMSTYSIHRHHSLIHKQLFKYKSVNHHFKANSRD